MAVSCPNCAVKRVRIICCIRGLSACAAAPAPVPGEPKAAPAPGLLGVVAAGGAPKGGAPKPPWFIPPIICWDSCIICCICCGFCIICCIIVAIGLGACCPPGCAPGCGMPIRKGLNIGAGAGVVPVGAAGVAAGGLAPIMGLAPWPPMSCWDKAIICCICCGSLIICSIMFAMGLAPAVGGFVAAGSVAASVGAAGAADALVAAAGGPQGFGKAALLGPPSVAWL